MTLEQVSDNGWMDGLKTLAVQSFISELLVIVSRVRKDFLALGNDNFEQFVCNSCQKTIW